VLLIAILRFENSETVKLISFMSRVDYTEILKAAKVRHEPFIEKLKEYVLVETPSDNPEQTLKLLKMIEEDFRELGFSTELISSEKSGGQLIAESDTIGSENKQLMIGHADTVWPVGTLDKMPWVDEGGVIRGPGVYDMKSGIVMMQMALEILAELDLKPALKPVVMITTDEEIGSPDSKEEILKLARTVDRVFAPEPSLGEEGRLKTSRKGSAKYLITVQGKAAHAGIEPEKGVSAIVEMAHIVQKLADLNDYDRGIAINTGTISGGKATNIVADRCEIAVGVRMLTLQDAETIDEKIRAIQAELEGAVIDIDGGLRRPPLEQNDRNHKLWEQASDCADKLGIELDHGLSGGGSDGSFTSQHAATLDGMGPVGDGAHSITEMLIIDKTLERVALLAAMLMSPAAE
jgi:glutamate carboxypeptidase